MVKLLLLSAAIFIVLAGSGIYKWVTGAPADEWMPAIAAAAVDAVVTIAGSIRSGKIDGMLQKAGFLAQEAFCGPDQKKQRRRFIRALQATSKGRLAKSYKILQSLRTDKKALPQDLAAVYFHIALLQERSGMSEDAVESYFRSLEFYERNDIALCNAGLLCSRLGRPAKAMECLKKALEITPDCHITLGNLAAACYRAGDYPGCVSYGERSHELKPDYLPTTTTLCMGYAQLGDSANSKKFYDLALSLGANDEVLRPAVEEILAKGSTAPQQQ